MLIRAALLGAGWWGGELARAAASVAGLEIVACHDPHVTGHGLPAMDIAAILGHPGIDAVLLATPHSTHAPLALQALAAGKHVFVEKPFTLDRASGLGVVAAAQQAGRILAVGHNRRFSPGVAALRGQLATAGTILHAEANFSVGSALRYQPGFWRADRREAAGGALASLGLHMVDVLAHLFGPVARVACIGRRRAVAVDIDDVTVGLLDFACGMTASLTTLFACPLTSHLRLSGTAAVIEATDDFATLRRRPMAGDADVTTFAGIDTVAAELAAFAAAIRGEAPFPVTPAEAVHNVAVMAAMVRSATDAGTWIEVEA